MTVFRSIVVAVLVPAILAGCAITPQQFAARRAQLSDAEVCRAWAESAGGADRQHSSSVSAEVYRRGLSDVRCTQEAAASAKATTDAIEAAAVILGVALVIAAAAAGGGGGSSPASDTAWDWDLFYNEGRQLVWACRGVQTGQFADTQRCAYKLKADTRWPSLQAP